MSFDLSEAKLWLELKQGPSILWESETKYVAMIACDRIFGVCIYIPIVHYASSILKAPTTKNPADDIIIFNFIFRGKPGLIFHVNPLPSRGFSWNIKSYFLWKTMKKYLWMSSVAVVTGALRVNNFFASICHNRNKIRTCNYSDYSQRYIDIAGALWSSSKVMRNAVGLQWLEHRWLVYHGYFELVLESLGKNPIAADIIIFGII